MGKKAEFTPLIQQYLEIKKHYPNSLLLFQVGDFYELFFDDAVTAAEFLAITLTKRGKAKGKDIPLCGVPVHALNHYVIKLVKGGFTVALCDQLSKPQPGTVVKRAVTKVYTPGTLTDAQLLDEKSASYLSIVLFDKTQYGVLFVELLTAQIYATTISDSSPRVLEAELGRFSPDEVVLFPEGATCVKSALKQAGYIVSSFSAGEKTLSDMGTFLKEQQSEPWFTQTFSPTLRARVTEESVLRASFEVLYRYLLRNQPAALEQFDTIRFYEATHYMNLDPATQHNLEVIKNKQNTTSNTLFSVLDHTRTAMGARLLKKWLMRPLYDQQHIERRLDAVTALHADVSVLQQLRLVLQSLSDLERIVGRIALRRAHVSDYRALTGTLKSIPSLTALLYSYRSIPLVEQILQCLPKFSELIALLTASINTDEHSRGLIKKGFSEPLDRLRYLVEQGQQEIMKLATAEAERLNISSLKILYTGVAGYFIEITDTHLHKVPDTYREVQKLVGRKRYVTPELRALEQEIRQAREDIESVEKEVFAEVETRVRAQTASLRHAATALATLDVLYALADVAYTHEYVRPSFNQKGLIAITKGRHPVVENSLSAPFIQNETHLGKTETLWIITGPNMGGKSTYLRQVALICLLAQIGSFVPAEVASLPLVDRIFTRIGSGDNVAQGKSTFLIEMEETATICHQATQHSLIILDEVGRGTSTDDGRALAQAIIEYLVDTVCARTLFATHYHELTALAATHSGIANYHLQCRKEGEELHFLHTLASGVATASFGIDVARLAHLPPQIIKRARILLASAAEKESQLTIVQSTTVVAPPDAQGMLTKKEKQVLNDLTQVDMNELSPRDAFELLWEVRRQLHL